MLRDQKKEVPFFFLLIHLPRQTGGAGFPRLDVVWHVSGSLLQGAKSFMIDDIIYKD
jgi:hypothetical protein